MLPEEIKLKIKIASEQFSTSGTSKKTYQLALTTGVGENMLQKFCASDFRSGAEFGFKLCHTEIEELKKELDRLRQQVIELNAPLIYFSTIDKDPVLATRDREAVIQHVLKVANRKVSNIPNEWLKLKP